MRHPFQTDIFDPSDPATVRRTDGAPRCHEGFHIGASAYLVDGVRWVLLHSPYPYPCHYEFVAAGNRPLAYPLPESFGECPHQAMKAFDDHWNVERRRLWSQEPMPEPSALTPSTRPAPVLRVTRLQISARERHILAAAGSVPLPGLEPWTVYGHLG